MPRFHWFLLTLLLILCMGIGWPGGLDLPVFYHAGHWALEGVWDRIYADNHLSGRFYYPPVSLLFFEVLGRFSFPVAQGIWLGLQVAAFALFWSGLFRLFPRLRRDRFAFFLVWLFAIKSIHASFQCGNIQLMLASLLLSAEWLRTRKSDSRTDSGIAAVVCGFLAVVKIFPAFVLVHYGITERRMRTGLMVGVALALALPFFAFGSHAMSLYQDFSAGLSSREAVYPLETETVSLSIPSLLARGLVPPLERDIAYAVIRWTSILLGAVFFFFFARASNVNRSHANWALALVVMTLLNPSSRPDYFVFFIPAFAMLALHATQSQKLAPWVALACTVIPIAGVSEWVLQSRPLNHQLELLRIPVLGAIVLAITLALLIRRRILKV